MILLALVACLCASAIAQSPWLVDRIYNQTVNGSVLHSVNGLVIDPVSNELLVLDASGHRIAVFDSLGFPRFEFEHWVTDPRTGQRISGEPASLAVSAVGEIYLVDRLSGTVDVLNIRGEFLDRLDPIAPVGLDHLTTRPVAVVLGNENQLYVAVEGEWGGVIVCGVDGLDCRRLIDNELESIDAIIGLATDSKGRLAVLDVYGVPAVRIYDPSGELLLGFSEHEAASGDLSFPAALLFATDGTFWVADALRQAVKHYDASGRFLDYIGGSGSGPGSLRHPMALAGDGVTWIAVGERTGRRVQVFVQPSAETPQLLAGDRQGPPTPQQGSQLGEASVAK